MKRFFFGIVVSTLLLSTGLFVAGPETARAQTNPTASSRCSGGGETLFLRFNYVPVANAGYIPNKAIIYIPKEAQCQGSYPLSVMLHGNNGRPDDISKYYIKSGEPGSTTTRPPETGNGGFQRAIETALRNPRVPGMIFVVPANSVGGGISWSGIDGPALKQAVQTAINADSRTTSLGIQLSNDSIIAGHSGAVCGNDLVGLRSLNPIAVGVLDGCSSVYPAIVGAFPNSTILLYAADMAYDSASFNGGAEQGGYHNDVPSDWQALATCDPAIFKDPPRANNLHKPGNTAGDDVDNVVTPAETHFFPLWATPQRPCTKSTSKPWYSLFATGVDHVNAVGKGMQTLLNIVYSDQPNPPTVANTNTVPSQNTNGATPGTPGTAGTSSNVVVPSGSIPLEVAINGSNTISGAGSGYVLNYTRVLFIYASGLAGTLALLMLIVSGIQIMAGGGGEGVKQAKERIINILGGIVLLGTSGFILYLINPCFFSFGTTQTCQPRVVGNTSYLQMSGGNNTINNFVVGQGAPPPPPGENCTPDGVCSVRLPLRFIAQTSAPDECAYDNTCGQNPNAGTHTDDGHTTPVWGQVSCGAASYLIAANYVKGIDMSLRDFVHQYFRCGIKNLPPSEASRINNYSAASAPRDYNDPLCAYLLGSGGKPDVLVRIMRQEFQLAGTRSVQLSPATIYRELHLGHPIVIGGVSTRGTPNHWERRAHYTTIVGIAGYNAQTQEFTNIYIHDVGYGNGANSVMSPADFNTLLRNSHGVAVSQ